MFTRDTLARLGGTSSAREEATGSRSGAVGGDSSGSTPSSKPSKLAAIFSSPASGGTPSKTPKDKSSSSSSVLRPPESIPPRQYISRQEIYRLQTSRSTSHTIPTSTREPTTSSRIPSAGGGLTGASRQTQHPPRGDRARREDLDDERSRILDARSWGHRQTSSLDNDLPPRTSSRGVALERLDTKALPKPPTGMSTSNSLPSLPSATSSAPPSPNIYTSATLLPSSPVESPPAQVRPSLPNHSSSSSSAAWDALLARASGTSAPAPSPPLPQPAAFPAPESYPLPSSRPSPPLPSLPSLPARQDHPAPPLVPVSREVADKVPRGPNDPVRPTEPTRPTQASTQTAAWENLLSRTAGAAPASYLGPPQFSVKAVSKSKAPPPEVSGVGGTEMSHGGGSGSGGWDALLARAGSGPSQGSQPSTSSGPGARVASFFKSKPVGRSTTTSPETTTTPLRTPPLSLDPPSAPALSGQRHRSPSPSRSVPIPSPPLLSTSSRSKAPARLVTRPDAPPLAAIPAPNLISKREDRPLTQPKPKPSIGITGLVRAPEGERGPRAKVPMMTSPCICCAATLQYPKDIASFRCTVCGTITDTDITSSARLSSALGHVPQPLTLARFKSLVDQAQAAKSPAPSISSRRDSLDDDVADACTLEGDSSDGEDTGGLTSEAVISLYGKTDWFLPVEDELFAVFSNWSSISRSFSNGCRPTLTESGIDLREVVEFYELLATLPPELGFAVIRGLEGLLRRPKRRFEDSPEGLGWVLVVIENPALFQPGSANTQSSGSVLKRFLGIVSNLPNEAHHYLVGWFNAYDRDRLERKIELINVALVPRIRKHAQAVTAPANRKDDLTYSHDWRFRSAARVLSLFFASNAHHPRLPVSAFYITYADQLDSVLDYETWIRTAHKKSKSSFFLSQYPFLMSLGAKLKVLVHDSKRQQNEQAGTSYVGLDGRRTVQPFITIRVRRERLLEDSLSQISSSIDHLKRALRIEFNGEEGVDAGGLKKEWFLLLCRELFGLGYGMWIMEEESSLCWFNPASFETDEQYTLVGVVVGLAVYHATALDVPLPTAAFKRLLNKPVTLADLASLRPALARGLQDLLDYDGNVEETFCRNFVGEYESFGEIISVPLIPDGENTLVTADNRQDFVDRLVQFILVDSVARQFRAFQRGWLSVVEGNALSLFAAEEIELCVRGSPEPLDVEQLRAVTKYDGCSEMDAMIGAFWEIVGGFDFKLQQKLLAFVTGSDRIPAQGLVNLDFRIQVTKKSPSHLPSSHTCFNTLSLPRYPSRTILERKLLDALSLSAGFGLK